MFKDMAPDGRPDTADEAWTPDGTSAANAFSEALGASYKLDALDPMSPTVARDRVSSLVKRSDAALFVGGAILGPTTPDHTGHEGQTIEPAAADASATKKSLERDSASSLLAGGLPQPEDL